MFEMQEDEYLESDFTDDQLRFVLVTYGPKVKDFLLLPGPVEVQHDTHRDNSLDMGAPRRGYA